MALASRQRPDRLLKRIARQDADCDWWSLDVTSMDAGAVLEQCIERFGRLDIIVNNAGVEASGPLAAMTDDAWPYSGTRDFRGVR